MNRHLNATILNPLSLASLVAGGVGFIEAVGLVAVTVAGSMMVGNVKVGEVEVRRLLKATLECCVRFEGGVEDEVRTDEMEGSAASRALIH